MLERGVALAPGPYEAMFPGLAHLDSHLDAVVDAAAGAAADAARRPLRWADPVFGDSLFGGLISPRARSGCDFSTP